MSVTWRQRLQLNPELAEIADWPIVVDDVLSPQKRRQFRRNYRIAAAILNGVPMAEVAAQESLSLSRLTQLMNRCLGSDEEDPPSLTYGLVPYSSTRLRRRRQPLGRMGERQPKGHSCAFKALLKAVPGLLNGLDAMLEAKLRDSPHSQRIAPQDAHGEFKRLLAEAQWPRDQYPYTTDSLAYESVRRYVHQRAQQLDSGHRQRSTRHRQGTAVLPRSAHRAYERIQIDEHRLDIENRLHLDLEGLRIPLRLSRASVLVAVDVFSGCCLGVHFALTKAPDQDALLSLVTSCLSPAPMKTPTTPGLTLMPGAGFPAQFATNVPVSLGVVDMDNAWMHRAESVANLLCDQLGATIHQSRSRNPLARALVESVFGYIATHVTHRFAATSGTGPQDPRRESARNRQHPPTCSLQTLEEALTLVMAEHNLSPQSDRGGLSPLDLLRLSGQQQCLRYRSEAMRSLWKPFEHREKLRIHRPADEHHRAYVNFAYCRYTNNQVLDAVSDTHAFVQFDRRDIRTLNAFSLGGKHLGTLNAPPAWYRHPHGLMLRLRVHQYCRKHRKHARDPLSGYFDELLNHRDNPEFALELLRVAREIGPGGVVSLPPTASTEQSSNIPTTGRVKMRERYAALVRGGMPVDVTND